MKKYVLYYDFRSGHDNGHGQGWDYKVMQATDLLGAIAEADEAWDDDSIYLLRIMEKVGKTETLKDMWKETYKRETYRAVLCKRSYSGWHLNDEKNGEGEHEAAREIYKNFEDISCTK